MQISFSDRQDWSLNGCLWLSQDNTKPKTKSKLTYLSNAEHSDEKIPREFKRHWKTKSVPMETVQKFRQSASKLKQPSVEEPKEDIEMMLQSQNWESMPDIAFELDRAETSNVQRRSF